MTGSRQLNTSKRLVPILPQTGDYVYCLEDLELAFPKEQLKDITRMWNLGFEIEDISDKHERHPHEIFLALFDQARREKIKRPFAFR